MNSRLINTIKKLNSFQIENNTTYNEGSSDNTRITTIEKAIKNIESLSILQEELFIQSIHCIKYDLFRVAHVSAWTAFIDFLENSINDKKLEHVFELHDKWRKYKSKDVLIENISEHQFITCLCELRMIKKSEMKSLHGLLAKRNECAHPTTYNPDYNETLGYIAELINRLYNFMNHNKD